jgi:hypothetical protein
MLSGCAAWKFNYEPERYTPVVIDDPGRSEPADHGGVRCGWKSKPSFWSPMNCGRHTPGWPG